MDKRELARQMGLIVFDTALPQPWLDAVADRVTFARENPLENYDALRTGLVWCYDFNSVGGFPVAITPKAAYLLSRVIGRTIHG